MEALLKKCGKIPRKQNPKPVKKMYAKRKRPAGHPPALRQIGQIRIILVELIVVLVILAILAAILVPQLLGWIDEAKKKDLALQARNVYMAAQATADEQYGLTDAAAPTFTTEADGSGGLDRVNELTDVDVSEITDVKTEADNIEGDSTRKDAFKIVALKMKFTIPGTTAGDDGNLVVHKAELTETDGWKFDDEVTD